MTEELTENSIERGETDTERPYIERVDMEFRADTEELDSDDWVEALIHDIAAEFDLNLFTLNVHSFEPQGVTGVGIVGDSHISVHTWPEHNFGHVELLSCVKLPGLETLEAYFESRVSTLLSVENNEL